MSTGKRPTTKPVAKKVAAQKSPARSAAKIEKGVAHEDVGWSSYIILEKKSARDATGSTGPRNKDQEK